MHCHQAQRIKLQVKRIEDGIDLLQNEAKYLEESTKTTQIKSHRSKYFVTVNGHEYIKIIRIQEWNLGGCSWKFETPKEIVLQKYIYSLHNYVAKIHQRTYAKWKYEINSILEVQAVVW